MSFWQNKGKEELVLVFDIGSSSVGGALFLMQKSGGPRIIFSVREPIVLEANADIDRFLSFTIKSLEVVARKVYTAGLGAPKRVFCVLSSSWYFSQTRVISFKKNVPFTFTSELADDLIKKEINLFEEEYLAKYPNSKNSIRLIEFKNIKVSLNGYETPNPLDQKAKELEITIFISMSSEQVLTKIEKTIKGYFHFEKIKFSSFVMASFVVVRDIYTQSDNLLLIEIGGEMTDISMVKKDILREATSFPLGRNFIIRGVASTLGSSLEEAKSSIALFQDEHLTVATAKKLEPVINDLKMEWLHKFQESLANLSKDISIPATIYMFVDKDLAEFFGRTIETEQFNQYTLTESKFKVNFLNAEIFQDITIVGKDTIRDPGLIIDAIYINSFFK